MCMYRPAELELTPIYTHHACLHNAYIGLTARHLLDNIPEPDWLKHTDRGTIFLQPKVPLESVGLTQPQVITACQRTIDKWIDGRRTNLTPLDIYAKKFGGFKRQRLVRSYNETQRVGKLDWRITAMVKCDKYDLDKAESKPPRIIQFRKPATNIEVMKAVAEAEHELLSGPGLGPTQLPMSSKGMTTPVRAEVWEKKRLAIKDAVCLMVDFEKLDAHLHTIPLEKLGHYTWRKMTGLPLKLLGNMLFNKGRIGSLNYTAVGTRMSGDQTTGGENTIITVALAAAVAEILGIKIEVLGDGDDSIIFISRKDLKRFWAAYDEICRKVFGLKAKMELAEQPKDEEYCQSRLAHRPDGTPHCIVDPIRALRRSTWVVNQCGGKRMYELLVGNLVSTYLMYPNTPILTRSVYQLLVNIGAVKDFRVVCSYDIGQSNQWLRENRERHINQHVREFEGRLTTHLPPEYLEVSELERFELHQAYGYSPETQVSIERLFPIGLLNKRLQVGGCKARQCLVSESLMWSNDMSSMMPDQGPTDRHRTKA